VEKLAHFEAEHTGPYGKIVSFWKRKGDVVEYSVLIPANSTGMIIFPVGKTMSVGGKVVNVKDGLRVTAGSYVYEVR